MRTKVSSLSLLGSAALLALSLPIATAFADNGGATRDDGVATRTPGTQLERIHFVSEGERCFRVVTAGVRTRHAVGAVGGTAGGTIILPPGPAAGNIIWAGLYWVILGGAPPINAVTLNGFAVAPAPLPVTASPCWAHPSAFAYFADVTPFVVAGANVVAGLDDSGAFNVSPESEGASLVVIYNDPYTTACEVIVLDGNDLLSMAGQVIDNALPSFCPPGLPARLHFIGGDGQTMPTYPFTDNQLWNGLPLGDGDDFDASDPPAPGATPDLAWDTDTYLVPAAPPYVASIDSGAGPSSDCINWIVTVLEVGEFPCQATPTQSKSWGQIKSLFK